MSAVYADWQPIMKNLNKPPVIYIKIEPWAPIPGKVPVSYNVKGLKWIKANRPVRLTSIRWRYTLVNHIRENCCARLNGDFSSQFSKPGFSVY